MDWKAAMGNADSVRLVCEQTTPIKQLEGFQKHHRVPTAASAGDQRFVCELAESQIDADMQDVFSALRKSYGLKPVSYTHLTLPTKRIV